MVPEYRKVATIIRELDNMANSNRKQKNKQAGQSKYSMIMDAIHFIINHFKIKGKAAKKIYKAST